MGHYSYSGTAGSNTTVDGIASQGTSDANLIDDLIRALAASQANFVRDLGGPTAGGSANALTVALNDATTLPAYFDGMVVGFIAASDNDSTTVTLNVDSVGAKAVKVASAGVETLPAVGAIQAGGYYLARYRSAWASAAGAFQLIDLNTGGDIRLPSGGVINFNGGDILFTHSSNYLAVTGGQYGFFSATGASSSAVEIRNQTDNASVNVLELEGDRDTPTDGDAAYFEMKLADSGGTQTTFARQTWTATDVTDTTEDGKLSWSVMKAGTLTELVSLDPTNGFVFSNATPGLKAFVRFNGTGTPAIAGGFNVASITDNGTGDYTINFTTALADTNYCVVATSKAVNNTSNTRQYAPVACGYATGSVRILTGEPNDGDNTTWLAEDHELINVVVYGT